MMHVDLTSCGLTNQHVPVLSQILIQNTSIKKLVLAHNQLGGNDGAASEFLDAIKVISPPILNLIQVLTCSLFIR